MLFGRDRICAVVAARDHREMARQLRGALKYTRTIEVRFDYVLRREVPAFLRWLARHRPRLRATLIATCRGQQAGGRFLGSFNAQCESLFVAVPAGFDWFDFEIEMARRFPAGALQSGLAPARVIVSFHDFRRTPRELGKTLARLERERPRVVKIATHCDTIADSLRVLALARGRRNVVAVPMGEVGLPARLLALRHGSALAYAAAGEPTAPGQLSLEEMKRLYRADQLNRRTRVYGVIGNPVSHSLSPLLHNVAFQARKINAVYLPFLVRDVRDFLAAVAPLGIAGFSVTLPHKEAILRHLDDCDPLAAAIGAVNTVVVRGSGHLYGYNTDYVGVLRALERRMPLPGSHILLYGAGGAARAVAFALAQGGAAVCVCARRQERARRLARAVGGQVVERSRLRREFFDAIVNTTPVGMHPEVEHSPLEAQELNCRTVMDLVYRPLKTRLLRLAERRKLETIAGVEIFLAQGTAQWEIWTGTRAPVAVMRRAVLRALRREEHSRI